MMKKSLTALAGLLAAGIVTAQADMPDVLKEAGMPAEMLGDSFETVGGLTGYVMLAPNTGQPQGVVYVGPDGDYALTGMMVGRDGEILTERHLVENAGVDLEALAEKGRQMQEGRSPAQSEASASSSAAEEKLAAMEQTTYIQQGEGAVTIYATMDPNCPHCTRLFHAAQNMTDEVNFRWVPVGVMGQDSVEKSAKVLSSENKLDALRKLKSDGDVSGPVNGSGLSAVRDNSTITSEAGMRGTPQIVIVRENGDVVHLRGGVPESRLRAEAGL